MSAIISLLPGTLQSGLSHLQHIHKAVSKSSPAPKSSATTPQELEANANTTSFKRRIEDDEMSWSRTRRSLNSSISGSNRSSTLMSGQTTPYATPDETHDDDHSVFEYTLDRRTPPTLMDSVREALLDLDLDPGSHHPPMSLSHPQQPLPPPRRLLPSTQAQAQAQAQARADQHTGDSGIQWDSVRRGLTKLSIARDERAQHPAARNPAFERGEYLGALRHLLLSLPADLHPAELASLQSSLPVSHSGGGPSDTACTCMCDAHLPVPRREQSVLHRLVKTLVAAALVLLAMILPHVVTAFQAAARAEKKYRVGGLLVSGAVDAARSAARQVAALSIPGDALVSRTGGDGDGRSGTTVGEAVASGVRWAVGGVAAGVADGLGEGLVIIRERGAAEKTRGNF